MSWLRWPKKAGLSVVFLAVVMAGYWLWALVLARGSFVPVSFVEANRQGALIAGEIVSLSRGTAENLEEINNLDKFGQYGTAIKLVEKELEKNSQLQQRVYQLSEQLAKMSEALPAVEPREAMAAGLKALNYETLLIIRLLNYSGFLNELFSALEDKFNGRAVPPGQVAELVARINSEAAAINRFNELYLGAIREFEELAER